MLRASKSRLCVTVSDLFADDEAAYYRKHHVEIRSGGTYPGNYGGIETSSKDPLKRHPRLIHMRRLDQISLE